MADLPKTSQKQQASDTITSDVFLLNEKNLSEIQILKVGTVHDRGFKITAEMLNDFVENFKANVYGSDIQINLGHQREGEAAGWVKSLRIDGDILLATVEWTPLGEEKIKNKQYKFTSSELALSHKHHETGERIKNVLIGVALTNVPAVKGMEAVKLSEEVKLYLNSINMTEVKKRFNELMEKQDLSESDINSFAEYAKDDEEKEEMLKKLKGRIKKEKLSEQNDKEQVSLSEFQKMKEENEQLKKVTEKLSAQAEKSIKLQEEIQEMKLSEVFENELALSESGESTGLKSDDETRQKVVSFMLTLSEDQLKEFKEIVKSVVTVDFSEKGKQATKNQTLFGKMEEAKKAANKRFAEDKSKDLAIHLSEVYVEMGLVE